MTDNDNMGQQVHKLPDDQTDIVERLLKPVMLHSNPEQTNAERREAAAEIERLRAALQEAARRLIANGDGYGANEATSALEPKPMRSNLGPGET